LPQVREEAIVRGARDEAVRVPRSYGGGDGSGMCNLVAFLADRTVPAGMLNISHLLLGYYLG
jgi:hypothetical protein